MEKKLEDILKELLKELKTKMTKLVTERQISPIPDGALDGLSLNSPSRGAYILPKVKK